MALDLALLTSPMTPSPTPGLDVLDPRFQEIAGLAEAGDYVKAAEQTQALLKENVVDIRVLSYFLYGAFLERGLPGLEEVLKGLVSLVGPNWPAIGPLNKKDRHTENGLAWFLTRLLNRLEDEAPDPGKQKPAGPSWMGWTEAVPATAVPKIVERCGEVITGLQAVAPSQKVGPLLKRLQDWLSTYERTAAAAAPAPEPTPEPAAEAAPEAEAAPAKAAPAAAAAAGPPPPSFVEGNYRIEELRSKLAAFEALVRKKDYARASVVANDVAEIVEHFDPRLYFPKLFSKFYALSFENLEQLEPVLQTKETPAWKAMDRLYRCDLDAFVK